MKMPTFFCKYTLSFVVWNRIGNGSVTTMVLLAYWHCIYFAGILFTVLSSVAVGFQLRREQFMPSWHLHC